MISPTLNDFFFCLLIGAVFAACHALNVSAHDKNLSLLTGQAGATEAREKQTRGAGKPDPRSDIGISECINNKIKASGKLKGQSISVSVSNSEASLIGSVHSESRIRSAASIAKQCHAKTINNALTVDLAAKSKGPKAKDIKPSEGEKKPPQP